MRDVGMRIVNARRELGLNQAELAERANVDATVLNRVEKRGLFDPTASFVLRIAHALGRSIDEVLTGKPGAGPILLVERGIPRKLVKDAEREIAARSLPLVDGKVPSASRKLRGPKRNARKA